MITDYLIRRLALVVLVGLSPLALARQSDPKDQARGAFLTTRQPTVASTPHPRPQQSRAKTKQPAANATGGGQAGMPVVEAAPVSDSIGLGYTLYQRTPNGALVRVNPRQVFRKGDMLRLIVESNIDGYLYVFTTEKVGESEGEPTMIFPHLQLNQGANRIKAHVLYEVPSSSRWFVFDERPATERLYLVITRQPILGVPIEGRLIAYCQSQPDPRECEWRPAGQPWQRIIASAGEPKQQSVKQNDHLPQSESEQLATRGLKLKREDAEPWVVQMNAWGSAGMLTTVIELIHQ